MESSALTVRAVRPGDEAAWRQLYRGYRDFYELAPDDAVLDTVWGWLLDERNEVNCLVADLDGDVCGLAHHRRFASPSAARIELYLDDLYTDPDHRGRGIARALIEGLADHAAQDGIALVSWITDAGNAPARRVYDRVATATRWVTYELDPGRTPM